MKIPDVSLVSKRVHLCYFLCSQRKIEVYILWTCTKYCTAVMEGQRHACCHSKCTEWATFNLQSSLWKAITVLCGFLSLCCVLSLLCVVVGTSSCGVVLLWCVEVVKFFFELFWWCNVVKLLCGLLSSLPVCGSIVTWCGLTLCLLDLTSDTKL